MLRKKKGQHMFGLPFVFIISIIIAAIIILVAVMTIKNFVCRGEQIQINLFVSDLRDTIEKTFYTTFESRTIFEGTLPTAGCSSIRLVCFGFPDQLKPESAQVAEDVWNEISLYRGDDKQLFFYPRSGLEKSGAAQSYNIEPTGIRIALEENPTCFQNTGKIEIYLKNQGEDILIENE